MNDIVIRPMTRQDIEQVTIIEKSAFLTPWSRETFADEMENKLAHYLVVSTDQGLIGYAGMWIILDEAHVTNVALLPEYRGQGFGKQLMRELIACAKRQGAASMTLEVRVGNMVAQNLYTKMGFVSAGIRPNYYTDTQEDALIMWCYHL